MDLLDRIDRQIDDKHLLKHPFYTKWATGTLPREAMQEYARQYFAFESSFPQFLSALHSRTADAAVRQRILDLTRATTGVDQVIDEMKLAGE